MPHNPIEDIRRNLKAPEFARFFGASRANTSFAMTLAIARQNAGLTQKALAEKAGVSQAYIAKLEGGEANPTLGRIGSLLAVLGLSLVTDVTELVPHSDDSSLPKSRSKVMVEVLSPRQPSF